MEYIHYTIKDGIFEIHIEAIKIYYGFELDKKSINTTYVISG